jgi:hypothetical protein
MAFSDFDKSKFWDEPSFEVIGALQGFFCFAPPDKVLAIQKKILEYLRAMRNSYSRTIDIASMDPSSIEITRTQLHRNRELLQKLYEKAVSTFIPHHEVLILTDTEYRMNFRLAVA